MCRLRKALITASSFRIWIYTLEDLVATIERVVQNRRILLTRSPLIAHDWIHPLAFALLIKKYYIEF